MKIFRRGIFNFRVRRRNVRYLMELLTEAIEDMDEKQRVIDECFEEQPPVRLIRFEKDLDDE